MGSVARAALIVPAIWMCMSAAARANDIVYVGADGNVWSTSPDGIGVQRLTADATAAAPYRNPALTQDGTVVVLRAGSVRFLDRAGAPRRAPMLAPGLPTALDVSPAGDRLLYGFLEDTGDGTTPLARIARLGAPALAVIGYTLPRSLAGTEDFTVVRYPAGTTIDVITRIGPRPWLFTGPVATAGYDITRAGYQMLAVGAPAESPAPAPSTLIYWDNGDLAPPDVGATATFCELPGFANSATDVSWSPDGTSFAWADAAGIHVSSAPEVLPDATCAIAPRLIVPGGTQPDWGEVDSPPAPEPAPTVAPAALGAPSSPRPAAAPTSAPTVRALRLRPVTFRAGAGTRVTYRASAATAVNVRLERVSRRGTRTRSVSIPGGFARTAVEGLNSFRFTGRGLQAGVYRMIVAVEGGAAASSLFAIRRSSR